MPARTARERWSQFLTFVVMWILAAIVGSALLFYFTGRSDPPRAAPEPEPTHVALEDRTPEPSPASVSEDAPEAPAPEPNITKVHDEPTPRTRVRVMTASERASKVEAHIPPRRVSDGSGRLRGGYPRLRRCPRARTQQLRSQDSDGASRELERARGARSRTTIPRIQHRANDRRLAERIACR